MAECVRFVCEACGHAIAAWSDGNPYFISDAGAKQYAYHPDHAGLERCTGNDEPHLCLSCGHECLVDSADSGASDSPCSDCGGVGLMRTAELVGVRCPFCKRGEFRRDSDFVCIS